MLEHFCRIGILPSSKERLQMIANGLLSTTLHFFNIMAGNLSGPKAEFIDNSFNGPDNVIFSESKVLDLL